MLESLARHIFPVKSPVKGVVIIVPLVTDVSEFVFSTGERGFIYINIPPNSTLSPQQYANDFRDQVFKDAELMPIYCEHLTINSQIIGFPPTKVQNFCFVVRLQKDHKITGNSGILEVAVVKNTISASHVMRNIETLNVGE